MQCIFLSSKHGVYMQVTVQVVKQVRPGDYGLITARCYQKDLGPTLMYR